MFTSLKALAQHAPLSIVIASAADDQLRVCISPTYNGEVPNNALKPMVLTGTATELDADFIAAVEIWQAPKRSIIEQAQMAAASNDADDDEDEDAGAATAARKPRAVTSKAKDEKPARGKRTGAEAAHKGAAAPAPAAAAPAPAPAPTPAASPAAQPPGAEDTSAPAEPAPAVPATAADGNAVDTLTLQLF